MSLAAKKKSLQAFTGGRRDGKKKDECVVRGDLREKKNLV